jgi:hypothetical protein
MFVGVILLWNKYPESDTKRRILFLVLKWSGLILLFFLLFIYRRNVEGEIMWINETNWSILGTIGWAYLSVSIIFIILKGRFWPLTIALLLMVVLNVSTKIGWTAFIYEVPKIFWPVGKGSHASITMAGLLLSLLFVRNDIADTMRQKIIWGIGYTIILFFAGWVLMPLGLAKIGSTPSFTMYTSAICVLIFIMMYILVDVKGYSKWASFMKPAGSNPLLTYILPDIYYAILGLSHAYIFSDEGWTGVMRAIIFSLFILALSWLMTRFRIRLQL